MRKQIVVWESTETVTISPSGAEGTYRVVWHREEGGDEEFEVTPGEGDTVEDAVAKDLRNRMGP